MNTLTIILAQSVTGAVIEIILLILGAAIIGFFTAWFYQKAHFTPIINKLETEKAELIKKVADLNTKIEGLNNDISLLKNRIAELEKVIAGKDKEIADLKKTGR